MVDVTLLFWSTMMSLVTAVRVTQNTVYTLEEVRLRGRKIFRHFLSVADISCLKTLPKDLR